LLDLAEVAREQGDLARATAYQRQSLRLAWEYGEMRLIVEALEAAARTAVVADRGLAAARLFAAAERCRDLTGIGRWTSFARTSYERAVAAARAALGEAAFAAAWAAGRALPLERAVAEALDVGAAPAGPPPGPLSPREAEVLRLLASGLPDREIAAALFVSVRTVEAHVARIFGKLGVRTRAAATAAAIAAGLVDSGRRTPS
jgi:non-specific serine/threonine protein kinase